MGKHSLSKTHKRTFNKTMAIALAAGVSFGGVQVIGPHVGMDTAGVAQAAETTEDYAILAPYEDNPMANFKHDSSPDPKTGEFNGIVSGIKAGVPDYSTELGEEGIEGPIGWNVDPNGTRDIVIEYTLNNPKFKFVEKDPFFTYIKGSDRFRPQPQGNGNVIYTVHQIMDTHYPKVINGKPYDKGEDFIKDGTLERETGIKYSIDVSDDGQKAIVRFDNVKNIDGFMSGYNVGVNGPYDPGETFTVNAKFVNGFDDPAYKKLYVGENKFTYTIPGEPAPNKPPAKISESVDPTWGNAKVPDGEIKKIPAGGGAKDAPKDTKYELTGDHPDWITIDKSTGEITAKPPKGTKPGKNQVTVKTTFPDGSTDTDKPVITVTHTPKTAESVDPTWGNAKVPDGGTKKIPAGGGAKDAPKGTKYELTGKHPEWITIDSKTGEITAKPPKGTKPGKNQVTVTTTFPDGSKDTDKPTITVTHSDIFIDGKPKVNSDGTVTLHRNDGEDITFKVPTGSKVEVNKDGDLVITQPDGKKETVPLKHTKVEEKGKPGTPDHKIIITDEDGKTHEFGTYDKFLKSVKDDGKGNYTFVMNDGTKLGPIQLGDDITNIADDGKGNLIVTHKDGSKDTVPLKHTTITGQGKPGDPDYAVTITTPDGKKITLDGYDNYVESIEKQKNGDYLVKRNDGTEWTIKLSDIRKNIKDLKGKDAEQDKRLDDLENRVDGVDKEITNLGDRITKNEGAIEDHRKSINDLNQAVGDINNELGDIKDELARLDGQDIKEVRDNGDGTYTVIRNNGDEVTGTIDTSGDIKSITDNGDGTITLTHNDGFTEVVDLTHTKVETKGKPGDKDYTVTITTPDGNKVTLNGSNTYPSKVKDNGDGTYTIILNDGSEVEGKIGDGQDIKELVPNEDGTLTIIHKDGTESKVDLKQVEITEENKGTPEHTVTITSPNGDSVTFNVFDKYVTNVVKNEDGNYDIFRSDVDGGNTVWKTIVLSDIRDKISALETRADKLDKKDADLQRQIDELKGRLDSTEKEIESLKDRTDGLEKAVAKINARLSVIELNITALEGRVTALEGRVDTVEKTEHAWAQCFSGVLGTAIPLLAAVPFVAGSNIQIPGAAEWNNQIQRTLGIYNEQLSRMAGQYSGVAKAAALVLGVAGTIGLGVHTAKACGPYSKTDAMKGTKAGKLSSKMTAKQEGSSREK